MGLIGGVGAALDLVFLLEATLGFSESFRPCTRDRPGLRGPPLVESAPGLAQPSAPPLRRRQLGREPIAARVTEALIFLGVDGVGLRQETRSDRRNRGR